MPRSNRVRKSQDQALKAAGKAPGQLNLVSMFARPASTTTDAHDDSVRVEIDVSVPLTSPRTEDLQDIVAQDRSTVDRTGILL
jgi:hypothetical protein